MHSSPRKPIIDNPRFNPLSLVVTTTLIAFLYIFMEWLFIITKPSFLQQAAFLDKVLVLFTTAALLTAICLLFLLPYFILHAFAKSAKFTILLRLITVFAPTLVLTSLALMMIDNFTYTVFNFGIVSAGGGFRILYAALFIFLGVFFFIKIIGFTNLVQEILLRNPLKSRKIIISQLVVILTIFILVPAIVHADTSENPARVAGVKRTGHVPNIVLITADSLEASKMSAYGYEKDTTPFLKQLASTSLVGENAFSNAQGTVGSITSILTGRHPLDTRIQTSMDILRGDDAARHLPGILRSYGYYSVQLSYSFYADAYRLNFQGGFDEANGRIIETNPIFTAIAAVFPTNTSYFIAEISNRLLDRLGHIFFIRDMTNPYLQVTKSPEKFNDQQKLGYALSLIEKTDQPLFIHIHWMGTHGPIFHPDRQVFSAGLDPETQKNFTDSFYLDSILEFDGSLEGFYQELQNRNLDDNTILIVASDHSQRWTNSRLPLIMHFPHSAFSKKITGNVQHLDIAPTVLDYLDINQPAWMAGRSLLSGSESLAPIFITEIYSSKKDIQTGKVTYPDPEPPFYQFGKISVISCNLWFELDLQKEKIFQGEVSDYQGVCGEKEIGEREAVDLISEYLTRYGFDASSLQDVDIDQ